MQLHSFIVLQVLGIACAAAIQHPRVLAIDIKRQVSTSLSKRSSYRPFVIDPTNSLYTAQITIGSGDTLFDLTIDTGSSDLWVPQSAWKNSTTFQDIDTPFNVTYGTGSASGFYGKDTVTWSTVPIGDMQFAIATGQGTPNGIFGIGLPNTEACVKSTDFDSSGKLVNDTAYDNFPKMMKNKGYTDSVSFSIWLNSPEIEIGSILFGGVDHTKYRGTLGRVPLIKSSLYDSTTGKGYTPDSPSQYTIMLNGLDIQNCSCEMASIMSNAALPVLLDTGSTGSALPADLVDAIAASLNRSGTVYWESQVNSYVLIGAPPCGSFIFDFSGIRISVPLGNFIEIVGTDDGEPVYALTIVKNPYTDLSSGLAVYILGQNFLHSAYVVYDVDRNEVALAIAKWGQIKTAKNEAIGSTGVPSATKAPRYDQTHATSVYSLATVTTIV